MRHDGAGAPAQRWAATVVVLMALASLPTVAAISAGSATLGDSATPDGTTPFIARPPGPPFVVVPGPPVPLRPTAPTTGAPEGRDRPADPYRRPVEARRGGPAEHRQHRRPSPRPPRRPAAPAPTTAGGEPATCHRPALGWRAMPGHPPRAPRCAASR